MSTIWLKLLKLQRNRNRTGFTIPFLIGAMRDPVGKVCQSEVEDYREFIQLIEQFQDISLLPNCIGISECVQLREPVVAFYNSIQKASEHGLRRVVVGDVESALLVSQDYYDHHYESFIGKLWSLSKHPISHGEFSFEKSTYMKFTAQDYDTIKQACELA